MKHPKLIFLAVFVFFTSVLYSHGSNITPIISLLLLDDNGWVNPAWMNPANLTATALSPEAVRLMWQDRSIGETGFSIEMKTGDGVFSKVLQVGPDIQQCDISILNVHQLTPGTAYQFRVRAFKDGSTTAFSNIAGVTTPAEASTSPETPSNFSAIPGSDSNIVLSWSDISNNEYIFRIERSINCNGEYVPAAEVIANSTNYTDTGLLPNQQYCYRIRTENNQGVSAWSDNAEATTLISEGIPNTPLNLQVNYCRSQPPFAQYYYSLTWEDTSNNEDHFEIWGLNTLNLPKTWTPISTPGENSESAFGATTNRYDWFRIRAVNSHGASNFSYEFEITYSRDLCPAGLEPLAPTNVVATTLSENTIRLTWDDVLYEFEYWISRSEFPDTGFIYIDKVTSNVTAYDDTGLSPNKTYYYKIGAWNTTVDPPILSDVVSATTEESITQPAAPSGLQASPLAKTSNSIQLTWTDNSDNETYFLIQRSLTNYGFTQLATVAPNQTNYTDTGLTPCTTYYYRVYSHNSGGPSSTAASDLASTAPAPPTGLIASQGTVLNGIFLDWNTISCATEYNVYELSSEDAEWEKINNSGDITVNYANVGPLTPAVYLFYRVSSVDANGNEGAPADYAVGWGASPIPTAVSASRGTFPDRIRLQWKPVQTCPEGQGVYARYINQYDIEWSSSADGIFTKFLSVEIDPQASDPAMPVPASPDPVTVDIKNANTYFPGVTPNTDYYFRVYATYKDDLNCDDVADNSSVWQSPPSAAAVGWAQSVAPTYLAAPQNLSASDGTSTTKIDVSWSPVTGAASYNVYRGSSTWGPWIKIRNISGTFMSNTTTDSSFGIIPGTGYWYFVKAVSSSGVEGHSSAYDGGFAISDIMTR